MSAEPSAVNEKSGHPKLAALFVGIGTLLTIFAIFSIWANRQALNTDNWVHTSDTVLQNKQVQDQLAAYVTNQIFNNVDVQGELSKQLPPAVKPLAGPAAGGLRQLAPQAVEKALATPQFEQVWSDANRAAHENLLKILDGGGDNVSTQNGQVTLDLNSLLTGVATQLGIGANLQSKIPADAGQLTVLKSDQLSTAQNAAKGIRKLPIVLTLLVILMYGLAIYFAGPRRRQALRSVGIGFAFAGVIALVLRGASGHYLVNHLSSSESIRPAAQAVWGIGTSLLVTVAASTIAFGVLLFLAAWLAGPTALARGLRREASPYVREQPLAAVAVAFVVWVALLLLVPIAAFGKPLGILIFAVLFIVGAEILRRQTLREFPDTEPGGLWDRIRKSGKSSDGGTSDSGKTVSELERLRSLHDDGTLSDAEFSAAKTELLGPAAAG